MAWSWRILRAAVEQEILFPNKKVFETYVEGLQKKKEPYEIVNEIEDDDGTVTVIMRKRYNPQNPFLQRG